MASACWLESSMEDTCSSTVRLPFNKAKKFFAVDCSGSTQGAIMRAQHRFVQGLHSNGEDQVTKWDGSCRDPGLVDGMPDAYYAGSGLTSPERIPLNTKAVHGIKSSELWILLTDGAVNPSQVNKLAILADTMDFIQVPIVFLITGGRYADPADTNVSVGVPFFANAREAVILFKDYTSSQLFLIDAKGSFERLKTAAKGQESEHTISSGWNALPVYQNEDAFCKACVESCIDFELGSMRRTHKLTSLGSQWASVTGDAVVNVPELLKQSHLASSDLQNLLGEEAINQLALVCKTRGQIAQLRDLLLRQRKQELVIRFEDLHGASSILEEIQKMDNPAEKERLVAQLREAHALNRETYERLRNSPSDEQKIAANINRSINRALAMLADVEKSGYTADILSRKSNRAKRADMVSADDADIYVAALELSNATDACRGVCPICCGEDQIMSIVLKKLETVENNTTDFALNFPLAAGWSGYNQDLISSQCICFQCALLLDRSIFKESIVAKIPAVSYSGLNSKYVKNQLYLALTVGLSTGVSGVIQLFTTILDRTLETKEWCSESNIADSEVAMRRRVLNWILMDFLQNCPCKEDFTESSQWVQYPKALSWVTKDYGDRMLDSWIIQYPITGFNQLLRWYSLLEISVHVPIENIKKAKLINITTATIMNGFRDEKEVDKSWTHPFLGLIYREFNAPGIPRDLGQSSLVLPEVLWTKLETTPSEAMKRFLKQFTALERSQMTPRIQIIMFWALFKQKGHAMPKTFFENMAKQEPLAPLVLDVKASVPNQSVHDVLMSIFAPDRRVDNHDTSLDASLPPFVSPYGPSLLECGFPGCNVKFTDPLRRPENFNPNYVRDQRAKHLQEIYGLKDSFKSPTGLPESTKVPRSPSSSNVTLHMSIARTWAALSPDEKQAISIEVATRSSKSTTGEKSQRAISTFTKAVRVHACGKSGRGNIYSNVLENHTEQILPSFMEALRVASVKMKLSDTSGLAFVHDWTKNTIAWKMNYEQELKSRYSGEALEEINDGGEGRSLCELA